MPDEPAAQGPEPENPPRGPEGNPQLLAATHKRSSRKKIVIPLVMMLFGLALFALAVALEPASPSDLPIPAYTRLEVVTTFPVSFIEYKVTQVSPVTAKIWISVVLPTGEKHPPLITSAVLGVRLPLGTKFGSCPLPAVCKIVANPFGSASFSVERLTFTSAGTATDDFLVDARGFGAAVDDVAASVAIPDITFDGPGTPILLAGYHIPSASSYYWSSFPATEVTNSFAVWEESLVKGDTPGRPAIGSNGSAQVRDNLRAFLAGALVGIGGAGLVAGIQEALDRRN